VFGYEGGPAGHETVSIPEYSAYRLFLGLRMVMQLRSQGVVSITGASSQRVLPFLLGERVLGASLDDGFSYRKCKFNKGTNKDNTGRVVVCTEIGIGRAYTFEASYCGAQHSRLASGRPAEVWPVWSRTDQWCTSRLSVSDL
jgi:hypothetical protein